MMSRKNNIVFLIISSLVFFSSCQKSIEDYRLPALTLLNEAYGSDPEQVMDIYLPAGRTSRTKVMILVHGGAWNAGDKSDFTAYVDTLKKRLPEYAIFNLNYRLANPPDIFPAQELDVKAALEFIYSKKEEYNISDKFVLLGASAGGHLALLQSYKYNSPVRVKAVIDFFGPTDLVDMYNNPPNPLVPLLLSIVVGGNPATNPMIYQQSSPLNFVSSQSPPTLIFHGATDIVVSSLQSVMLKNNLQANGVPHEYYLYLTEGHGWVGINLTDSFNKIMSFLNIYVN